MELDRRYFLVYFYVRRKWFLASTYGVLACQTRDKQFLNHEKVVTTILQNVSRAKEAAVTNILEISIKDYQTWIKKLAG